jgi:phosphomannomutase
LHEAIATAIQHGINLVIANDPDADRLAVAENVSKIDENGKLDIHQAILNTNTLILQFITPAFFPDSVIAIDVINISW